VYLLLAYCKADCVADYLSNLGHSHSFAIHYLDAPNKDLSHWLQYDIIGVSLPHQIRILNNI
ncbi:hypothetical protein LINGRAHAP2_LOCUS36069, partial [Linum grandiflorum]